MVRSYYPFSTERLKGRQTADIQDGNDSTSSLKQKLYGWVSLRYEI